MRLWIRADASPSIGLGHVMRSLAVAERAVHKDIVAEFVIGGGDVGIRTVRERGLTARPAPDLSAAWIAEMSSGDCVVFDGYHFAPGDMQACRDLGCRVGAIDDLGTGDFPVDVLLNQNPPLEYRYSTLDSTVRLFGPRYALVREEFAQFRRDRADALPRVLLVTMGGADVADLTVETIEILRFRTAFERVVAVVGPAAELTVDRTWPTDIEIVRNPRTIGAVFDRADAAVAASGSTTWELLSVGMPTALVRTAENQDAIGPGVARAGAALFLGDPPEYRNALLPAVERLAAPDVRRQLSRKALATVDGLGADRFLDALIEIDRR